MSSSFDGPLGAALPASDGWLLAAGDRLVHLGVSGTTRTYASVVNGAQTRFNDGTCDRRGRALVGTMDTRFRSPLGALSVWNAGRPTVLKGRLAISNGVGWSPDGGTLYLADTQRRLIWRADYDHDEGSVRNWRAWDVGSLGGKPDGLCVDREGGLWVALWDGGAIARLNPDGSPAMRLEVPARYVSACCFGGARRDLLYVTTAESAPGLGDGRVLVAEVGAEGLPEPLWDPAG